MGNLKPRAALIVMICGLFLAFYPFVYHRYYLYINQKEAAEIQPFQIQAESGPAAVEGGNFPERLIEDDGILEIPSLKLLVKVGYGVEEQGLERGPGFYPQSQYPDRGNVSIAGHRNIYGLPFLNLHKLKAADRIILTYRHKRYTYAVQEVFETHSRDWSVIAPTPEPVLTLTTCTPVIKPPGGDYDRLIVRAKLVTSNPMLKHR